MQQSELRCAGRAGATTRERGRRFERNPRGARRLRDRSVEAVEPPVFDIKSILNLISGHPSALQTFNHVVVVANARIPGERAQSIQTVRTAAAFAKLGCRVDLFYARRRVKRAIAGVAANDPLAYYGVAERVALHAVPVIDFIESVPRRFQYLPAKLEEATFARNAARAILRIDGALVHCREIEVGLLLARKRHPHYLFEAHSIPGNRVRKSYLNKALRGAIGIVSITKGLADDLAAEFDIPRESIHVVPDAFDPAGFVNLPGAAEARRITGAPADGFLVVYAGHLFAWKGVDTLLDAAALAPKLQFRLVGGLPEDVDRTRARAAALNLMNIEITGHRPPSEIPMHLRAADAIVVPNSAKQQISARHTSPLKLFEAMASERAIVASDLPSLREVLADRENALLVPPDDAPALAAALETLARDESLRKRLAGHALEQSSAYTFEARARRLLEIAQKALLRDGA